MSLLEAKNLKRFFIEEVPSGTVNGSNTAFTLSQEPLEGDALWLFLDGIKLKKTTHYSVSGVNITMVDAPALGQFLEAQYVQKTGGT